MDQQLLLQAAELEKHVGELQNHLKFIDQQLQELTEFHKEVTDLKGIKDKSILSSLGKGIYAESSLESDQLLVNVGSNTFVKKSPEQLAETLEKQVTALKQARVQVSEHLEGHAAQLEDIMKQLEKQNQTEK